VSSRPWSLAGSPKGKQTGRLLCMGQDVCQALPVLITESTGNSLIRISAIIQVLFRVQRQLIVSEDGWHFGRKIAEP
jgi:hypothetical protein